MKVGIYILYCFLLFGVVGCKNETQLPAIASQQGNFFDLKKVVEADISQLQAGKCNLQRQVTVDGKKQHASLDPAQIDFEKELEPLKECDINKAAWRDEFAADSSEINGEKTVHYSTSSDKIHVKSLRVTYKHDTVQKVEIVKEIRSFAFSFDSQIDYYPGKGYDIHTAQKAFLIHKFVMEVQARFVCK